MQNVEHRLRICLIATLMTIRPAVAASTCEGKPDALGTSRVIAVDPREHTRIGSMQYQETLPLADHEVVLSFDDGPSPRYTNRILDALAAECVKATFFMVGEMVMTFPSDARRVYAAGHTIGTHSFDHPFTFNKMSEEEAGVEIDQGVDALADALGDPTEIAPFFRVPGFLTSKSTEAAIASRGLMTWSADVPADDWKGISSAEIVKRAISRLEAKGRGVLLLHDIHRQTADAVPIILKELKARGFKIVQIVPASAKMAKTETTPEQWLAPRNHQPAAEPIQVSSKQAHPEPLKNLGKKAPKHLALLNEAKAKRKLAHMHRSSSKSARARHASVG
jgi:peptidoglycan/xylan/chitin deacetylase (PgdA/CDA1 family)